VDLQDCEVFQSKTHPCAFEIITPEESRRAAPQRDQYHYVCVAVVARCTEARRVWRGVCGDERVARRVSLCLCSFRAESELVMNEWVKVLRIGAIVRVRLSLRCMV
jgi:hypothetical protein